MHAWLQAPTHIPIHDVFTKPDKHKCRLVHQTIIIVIKDRIHYSNSGGGHHTHTPAGMYWSNEDMATLNMIWAMASRRVKNPVVDAFMTRMIG